MLLLLRIYLILHLAIAWGYGVTSYVVPQAVANSLGIALQSNTALADFRAMYGGLMLGMGAVFLLGLMNAGWRAPAVWLAVATGAGLLLGRLLTLLIDGPTANVIYIAGALDLAAVVLGMWLLGRRDIVPPVPTPR